MPDLKWWFHGTDVAGMSKRAMLWLVGLVGFGFTFLAAANVKEYYTLFGDSILDSRCSGLGAIHLWFDDTCSNSLPTRLGVMAIGLIVLLVCGYFAEKGRSSGTPSASRTSPYGHHVRFDSRDVYLCGKPGCGFETKDAAAAEAHVRIPTTGATSEHTAEPPTNAYGFEPLAVQAAAPLLQPTSPPPEFKTCPDCAEEVRTAARKCRFCGYMFELESAPSSSA